MAAIKDCKVDQEFRELIPVATWDERADLEASVRQFGYLTPIIVWRNERGEVVILDGHGRWELWRAAVAKPDGNGGLAAREPSVVEVALADRDSAMLFVINSQLGRRNVAKLDRIMLVSKREEIVKRLAKLKQSAAGGDKKSVAAKSIFGSLSELLPKAISPIDSRKVSATEAGVSEKSYSDGKAVLAAVADGTLSPTVVEDIRVGKASISGVAKNLKGKAARKAKPSGWPAAVNAFATLVRRVIKRDPNRRAEIAAELRRLADEFELDAKSAA